MPLPMDTWSDSYHQQISAKYAATSQHKTTAYTLWSQFQHNAQALPRGRLTSSNILHLLLTGGHLPQNMTPPERIPKSWTTRPTRRTRPRSPYHMGRLLRSSHKLIDQHHERPRGPRSHSKSLARTSRSQIPTLAIRARLPLTPRWKTPLPIR
jgi:hypothetical protein